MLPKDVMIWCFHWTFLCQCHSSNHSYQQNKRPDHQLKRVDSVQSNSLVDHRSGRFPSGSPKSTMHHRVPGRRSVQRIQGCQRILIVQHSSHHALSLDPSNRVASSLVSQDFCGLNVQLHHHKLKLNSLCSYIDQKLQLHKKFKTQKNLQTRTVLKGLHQVEHCMHRIFASQHLEKRSQCSGGDQLERSIHSGKKETRTLSHRIKSSMLYR